MVCVRIDIIKLRCLLHLPFMQKKLYKDRVTQHKGESFTFDETLNETVLS